MLIHRTERKNCDITGWPTTVGPFFFVASKLGVQISKLAGADVIGTPG
jgi:hypothetical protein